ncbi:Hypothetical predicted protein, partial [Pelobates cultripes]
VKELGDRTAGLEDKMVAYEEAQNSMAEKLDSLTERMEAQEGKTADLEDRGRRNNLRIRGIAENIGPTELTAYLVGLFKALAPDVPPDMFLMDRAHRVPKPTFLPPETPRDVLLRMHYFHIKEEVMRANRTRKKTDMPAAYQAIAIYADISAYTLRRRKEFAGITTQLRQQQIPYRWGYPVKLIVQRNGRPTTIQNPDEGMKILRTW